MYRQDWAKACPCSLLDYSQKSLSLENTKIEITGRDQGCKKKPRDDLSWPLTHIHHGCHYLHCKEREREVEKSRSDQSYLKAPQSRISYYLVCILVDASSCCDYHFGKNKNSHNHKTVMESTTRHRMTIRIAKACVLNNISMKM